MVPAQQYWPAPPQLQVPLAHWKPVLQVVPSQQACEASPQVQVPATQLRFELQVAEAPCPAAGRSGDAAGLTGAETHCLPTPQAGAAAAAGAGRAARSAGAGLAGRPGQAVEPAAPAVAPRARGVRAARAACARHGATVPVAAPPAPPVAVTPVPAVPLAKASKPPSRPVVIELDVVRSSDDLPTGPRKHPSWCRPGPDAVHVVGHALVATLFIATADQRRAQALL